MSFAQKIRSGVTLFDGGMGTQIQGLALDAEAWQGREGCSEILNLSAPEAIEGIHRAYLEAGADVVETNTFGANAVVLAEYELGDRLDALNRGAAQIARRAVDAFDERPAYVAGSMGPGTRLASLGQIDFDALYESYRRQAEALIDGGVDLLLIETCQDLLQIKAALLAARDAREQSRHLPLAVTVTVETNGRLLVGSDIEAVLCSLEPFELDILGLNCATGPDAMLPHVRQVCAHFAGKVLVQPNAGIPENKGGQVCYPLDAESFAEALLPLVDALGVELLGGCCGTTPAHIQALRARVESHTPLARAPRWEPAVASLFSATTLRQDPAPFFIGERTNANGSKAFQRHLQREDWDGAVAIAREQQKGGAHGLDVCVAAAGRDEARDMRELLSRLVQQVDLPIFVDSTELPVLESALKLIGGRAVINSVNLEGGEERAEAICALARRYGAALIALTIDEQGMAMQADRKLQVARRLHQIAVERCGLRPRDLLFDALTFTLGSGDTSLHDAATQTLEALRQIRRELPGVHTVLGLSNISFGLKPASRRVLNSVFLAEAVEAGLDAAIVNAGRIQPLYRLDPEDRERALDLIYRRGEADPLLALIAHFDAKGGELRAATVDDDAPLETRIFNRVVDGERSGIDALLDQQLASMSALDIVNQVLIAAMKKVGELFGAGEMQLPFVLQAAEVMKHAVDHLEPHIERSEQQRQKSLVLATVRGDVHDIGKNLVDIILSNNGYKVYNLGINCDIGAMIDKAQEVRADAIGMSGLLVKSTVIMRENLQTMQQRGVRVPVLLGGAALTPAYVVEHCAEQLEPPVLYCADAFAGLTAMEALAAGELDLLAQTQAARTQRAPQPRRPVNEEGPVTALQPVASIPRPPFWGARIVERVAVDDIFAYLNEVVLFRGRWGYRRGGLDKAAYQALIGETARPQLDALKKRSVDEGLLQPQVVYGYYPCHGDGEQVIIYEPGSQKELLRLDFPRQHRAPRRCIADFFRSKEQGDPDVIALQVVTIGARCSREEQQLYAQHRYKDYLLLHGFGVEMAEALAELWHRRVREELGITAEDGAEVADLVAQSYRGSRYSFGYPACPDLEQNAKLFTLLEPERIGVTLSESGQMLPEQTTSAFIVHHPQAKYFTLG